MKLLVIEDEQGLWQTIAELLERECFLAEWAPDYDTAMQKINDYDYDCVLLDIMIPGGSGLAVLKEIKKQRKQDSVIIISAKDSVEDKVRGLEMGADDYLAKPFHLAELNARIKSVFRRKLAQGASFIELDNLMVYPEKRVVYVNGKDLPLNRKEFDLLYYFVSNPGRLLNKMSLAESVWGDHIDQADSLDFIYSQIKNLRRKMRVAGAVPEIKAVYGFGYKLVTGHS